MRSDDGLQLCEASQLATAWNLMLLLLLQRGRDPSCMTSALPIPFIVLQAQLEHRYWSICTAGPELLLTSGTLQRPPGASPGKAAQQQQAVAPTRQPRRCCSLHGAQVGLSCCACRRHSLHLIQLPVRSAARTYSHVQLAAARSDVGMQG